MKQIHFVKFTNRYLRAHIHTHARAQHRNMTFVFNLLFEILKEIRKKCVKQKKITSNNTAWFIWNIECLHWIWQCVYIVIECYCVCFIDKLSIMRYTSTMLTILLFLYENQLFSLFFAVVVVVFITYIVAPV